MKVVILKLFFGSVLIGLSYANNQYERVIAGNKANNVPNYFERGCYKSPCGTNAVCQETVGGEPVCSCPPGYSGHPLTICHKRECSSHNDCQSNQACRNYNCENPCTGACGTNANCEVKNHVPICSCPARYAGDPFSYCQQIKRHECESDGECNASQYCSNWKCVSGCEQCGKGATCSRVQGHRAVCECPKGYIGSPTTECRPECYGDLDCPGSRPACFYGSCKNPCNGACGTNAICNLRGLTPICSCPRDMTGNPFISCRSLRGECQSNSECPYYHACINNSCVNPCIGKCGINANCDVKNHTIICSCPTGYSGNPFTACFQGRRYTSERLTSNCH